MIYVQEVDETECYCTCSEIFGSIIFNSRFLRSTSLSFLIFKKIYRLQIHVIICNLPSICGDFGGSNIAPKIHPHSTQPNFTSRYATKPKPPGTFYHYIIQPLGVFPFRRIFPPQLFWFNQHVRWWVVPFCPGNSLRIVEDHRGWEVDTWNQISHLAGHNAAVSGLWRYGDVTV